MKFSIVFRISSDRARRRSARRDFHRRRRRRFYSRVCQTSLIVTMEKSRPDRIFQPNRA